MKFPSIFLLVILGVSLSAARIQPPVSISLTTKWRSTSFSCEALEFVATESPNKYWPFVNALLKNPANSQDDYFPKQAISEILTDAEFQQLKMAMDLRLYSPRVAMHYQVADQEWKASNPSEGCGEKNGTWVLHAPSLTSFCSLETLQNFVTEKEACTPSEGSIYLPEDLERVSETEGEREWVLYSDLEKAAPFISYFNEHNIPFIFRYNQKTIDSSDSEWEPTTMQGYGVRIDLKKMEYKVVDESSSSDDDHANEEDVEAGGEGEEEDSEVHGFYFKRLLERKPELKGQLALFRENLRSLDISPDESVEYYKSVKPWDLKQLPLRAAQRILKSVDPLATLLDITQNLPSYAKALSKVKLDAQIEETLEKMYLSSPTVTPGTNALLLNGNLLPSQSLTPLSLYETLSSELKRSSLLHSLHLPDSLLPYAIAGPKLSPSLESSRFDIRSKAVTWIHTLSAPEYQGRIPSSVASILSIPEGQVGYHSKHPATLVLGGDPSRESFRDALTEIFMRIRQGFALRVGLVMASDNEIGKTLINCFYFFQRKYNDFQAMSALLGLSKYSDLDQLVETLAQNGIDPEIVEGFVASDSKLRKKPRHTQRFLDVIGVNMKETPWEATMFVNGIPILVQEEGSYVAEALEVAAREFDLIKDLIEAGKITDKTGGGDNTFYNYLLTQEGVGEQVPRFLWEKEPLPEIFKRDGEEEGEQEGFFGDLTFLGSDEQELGEMVSHVLFADFGSVEGLVLMRDLLDVVGVCGVPRAGEVVETESGCAKREGDGLARVLFLSSKSGAGASEVVVKALQAVVRENKGEALKFVRLLVSGLLELGEEGLGEKAVLKVVGEVAREVLGEVLQLKDNRVEEKEGELRKAFGIVDSDSIFGLYSSAGMMQKIEKKNGFPRSSLVLWHRISLDSLSSLFDYFVEEYGGAYGEDKEAMSNDFFLLSSFLVHYGHEDSFDISGVKAVGLPSPSLSSSSSSPNKVHTIVGILDPISSEAHKIAKMMSWVANYYPEIDMKIILNPRTNLQELPTKSYYQYVLSPNSFEGEGQGRIGAEFLELPQESLLTVEMEVDPSWLVLPVLSVNDLDNLKLADIKDKEVYAQYEVASLLYQGQCFEGDFRPPQGLQLYLGDSANEHMHDTIVMMNGYFQLQALPGVWSLSLAEGKAREAYTITEEDKKMDKQMVVVSDYVGDVGNRLNVRKRPGMEDVSILDNDDDEEEEGMFSDSWWGAEKKKTKKAVVKSSVNDTIHVFSLASGHLYERFLKIMVLSVLKHTNNPVKFWFVANFLSPQFKTTLPEMAKAYNFDFEFVTYQWPWWLNDQTEKQRRIWGYKILFLDVLFPLNVEKVIYVDADQIVRADLKELVDMDLEGAVYGFTPMCNDRVEMEGFRFWRQGYWKDHLREKPYHISALYVVDLVRFRNEVAGDRLRSTYDSLSQDKNSLANLDQDLPNFMQHQLRIFSLPQEWLWCETWCGDDTKEAAKTIDLCNNPLTKTPKLENAVRIVDEWTSLDEEARSFTV